MTEPAWYRPPVNPRVIKRDYECWKHRINAQPNYYHRPHLKPGCWLTIEETYIRYRFLNGEYMGTWCNGDCYDHNIREG